MMVPALRLLGHDLVHYLAILAGIAIAPVPLLIMTSASPQWPQIPFFMLCATQLFICVRMAPFVDVRKELRIPVNAAGVILVVTALLESATNGGGLLTLYFQDKSHAAVAATCVSFLLLWVNESFLRMPFSVLVFFIAVATASRLVVFAAPFLAVAMLSSYAETRRRAGVAAMVYVHHLMLITVSILVVLLSNSEWASHLLERLSGTSAAGAVASHSTQGHIELAKLAAELKSQNLGVTVFGVGPGGFGDGIRDFGIDASGFGRYDPFGYQNLVNDYSFVPIHSVNLSLLVEFPVWVSVAFFVLWWRMGWRLWRNRNLPMLCMAGSLFSTTMFYSTHNEYLYTAALSVLCLSAFRDRSVVRVRREADAVLVLSKEM